MPKWCKLIVAVLLLPLCFGAVRGAVAGADAQRRRDDDLGGLSVRRGVLGGHFLLLPKPMWVYVFGHELTHALWTWLMGGRVKQFKATSKGGHVIVTKTNFLIALAPYFFPVYAVLVVAGVCHGQSNLELGALRGVVSPAAGGGVCVPCDADVAYPENRAIGHHAAWVFVFGGGDFPGKHDACCWWACRC